MSEAASAEDSACTGGVWVEPEAVGCGRMAGSMLVAAAAEALPAAPGEGLGCCVPCSVGFPEAAGRGRGWVRSTFRNGSLKASIRRRTCDTNRDTRYR